SSRVREALPWRISRTVPWLSSSEPCRRRESACGKDRKGSLCRASARFFFPCERISGCFRLIRSRRRSRKNRFGKIHSPRREACKRFFAIQHERPSHTNPELPTSLTRQY